VASLHQGAGHPQSRSPPGLRPAEPRLRARLDHQARRCARRRCL